MGNPDQQTAQSQGELMDDSREPGNLDDGGIPRVGSERVGRGGSGLGVPSSRIVPAARGVEAVDRVLASGTLSGNGSEVRAFEAECAEWLGARDAVAVCSGTSALYLALSEYVRPGDRVITSPISFFATVEAIMQAGAVPLFVDVNSRGQMDADAAVEAMRNEPGVTAICPVHMYGDMVDMDPITNCAAEMGIAVIEDACQGHGAAYKKNAAGTLGDLGCMSFYATKHVTTLGEGGLITIPYGHPGRGTAQRLRARRSHGMTGYSTHLLSGSNYRMSEAAAAYGREALAEFPAVQAERVRCSNGLWTAIGHDSSPFYTIPRPGEDVTHGFFWLPLLMSNKELARQMRAHLLSCGIETRQRYTEPLQAQPVIRRAYGEEFVAAADAATPMARRVAAGMIGLPTPANMTQEEFDRIVNGVWGFSGITPGGARHAESHAE